MSDIQYQVKFSARRSISIIVSPDKGVTVRAPYRTSPGSIDKFVRQKSDWIRGILEKHSGLKRINHGKKYEDGESFLFMGVENYLKIRESVKISVDHSHNIIQLSIPAGSNKLKIKAILDGWYKHAAARVFESRLEELMDRYKNYGFSPTGFKVRSLKSRWGSCSSKGNITISSELIKLDPVFADYVIIHELCHLKHHNHGKEFYELLEELVPDYKAVRKELRMFLTK